MINRWDPSVITNLSDEMRVSFNGLYNTLNSISEDAFKLQGRDISRYLKVIMVKVIVNRRTFVRDFMEWFVLGDGEHICIIIWLLQLYAEFLNDLQDVGYLIPRRHQMRNLLKREVAENPFFFYDFKIF